MDRSGLTAGAELALELALRAHIPCFSWEERNLTAGWGKRCMCQASDTSASLCQVLLSHCLPTCAQQCSERHPPTSPPSLQAGGEGALLSSAFGEGGK